MTVDDETVGADEPGWSLLLETLEPAEPPPELRSRLLAAVAGSGRYLPFVPTLGRVFDLEFAVARALLARAARRGDWKKGAPPVTAHVDFTAGPRCGTLRAGFVAMEGGVTIPRHRHADPEVTLVLEGAIRSNERRVGPGDVLEMASGSEHVFETEAEGAVFAVLRGRVEFLG